MEHSSVYPGYGTPMQSRRHQPVMMDTSPYKFVPTVRSLFRQLFSYPISLGLSGYRNATPFY